MIKSKSLASIEQKIESADEGSFRQHVLQTAKDFKTSWIELGRSLYAVWKDKLYKEWGYSTLEAYTAKEIGIKKTTALKLLRSYYFLEKEEPDYLRSEVIASTDSAQVPNYESVDLLRLAKNKKDLDSSDYARLKKDIFEKGKDASEVKKDLTALIRQRRELDPDEARKERGLSVLKRFLGTLKALKREIEVSKLASVSVIKEAQDLIARIESEINV